MRAGGVPLDFSLYVLYDVLYSSALNGWVWVEIVHAYWHPDVWFKVVVQEYLLILHLKHDVGLDVVQEDSPSLD